MVRRNNLFDFVDALLSLTPLLSYPCVSRPRCLRTLYIRQLLRLLWCPRCLGLLNVLCWVDISGRYLPPPCWNQLHESYINRLHSCYGRGRGSTLMARWFHCCGCQHREQCMSGRRAPLWVAQGSDSVWGVGMAAIRDYHNPHQQTRLQQLFPAQ